MAIDTSKAMRWMTNNFLETGFNTFTLSSLASGYTKADIYDPTQRTKTVKFGGRFLIDSTNNKIYIGGVTYTVASADYATPQALATAIQTAISALTITVAYSSTTMLFTFTRASNFVLTLSSTTAAIWNTIGLYSVIDTSAALTHTTAVTRIHWPYEQIDIDFGYQAPIGFVGIIGDLSQELRIPEGAVVTILGNTVNSFVTPPLEKVISWHETGMFRFIDDLVDSTWQYVRIKIECPTGPFHPEIGYLYVGDYSVFEDSKNISTGFELIEEDPSTQSSSDDGQIYSNDRTPYRIYSSLDVGLAKQNNVTFLRNIFKRKQRSGSFFISLDPTSYLSDNLADHLAFVRFSSPPRYKHIIRNIFELSFEVRESL